MHFNWNFIERLAQKTAEYRVEKMNGDYSETEAIISKYKNKPVKLNKEDIIEVQQYAWFSIYSEIFILAIILILATIFKILVPTIIIVVAFLISRVFFKGSHLNTYGKCCIFTISYIIGFSCLSNLMLSKETNILIKVIYYATVGFVLEVISLSKWFERITDRVNKI